LFVSSVVGALLLVARNDRGMRMFIFQSFYQNCVDGI
jgi:hypothetical protein